MPRWKARRRRKRQARAREAGLFPKTRTTTVTATWTAPGKLIWSTPTGKRLPPGIKVPPPKIGSLTLGEG